MNEIIINTFIDLIIVCLTISVIGLILIIILDKLIDKTTDIIIKKIKTRKK